MTGVIVRPREIQERHKNFIWKKVKEEPIQQALIKGKAVPFNKPSGSVKYGEFLD